MENVDLVLLVNIVFKLQFLQNHAQLVLMETGLTSIALYHVNLVRQGTFVLPQALSLH